MTTYCNKCGINWVALWSQDLEHEDESYEYCPLCCTGMDLEEGREGPAYMMDIGTSEIVDPATGEILPTGAPIALPPRIRKKKIYTETVDEYDERRITLEDQSLEEYFRMCKLYGKEKAATMVTWRTTERQFYYE